MTIIFFGDSIGCGEGVSPHKIWVTRLARLVEQQLGEQFVIINSSVSGNTTRIALERMPSDVQKMFQRYGVGLMVLQFGLNDCNYWQTDCGHPRVSPEAFKANLLEIIDRAQTFGARRIILNTNHPSLRQEKFAYTGKSYEEGNVFYNEIIRNVATQKDKVSLIDIESAFKNALSNGMRLQNLLLKDGLHLSTEGHNLYYEIVKPIFLSVVSDILAEIS